MTSTLSTTRSWKRRRPWEAIAPSIANSGSTQASTVKTRQRGSKSLSLICRRISRCVKQNWQRPSKSCRWRRSIFKRLPRRTSRRRTMCESTGQEKVYFCVRCCSKALSGVRHDTISAIVLSSRKRLSKYAHTLLQTQRERKTPKCINTQSMATSIVQDKFLSYALNFFLTTHTPAHTVVCFFSDTQGYDCMRKSDTCCQHTST